MKKGKKIAIVGATFFLMSGVSLISGIINGEANLVHAQDNPVFIVTPSDDAYIDQAMPDTNFGSDTSLYTKNTRGDPDSQFSYIKFDLSNIPLNSTITSAHFKIYVYGIMGLSYLFLENVAGSWNEETLTWNNKPEESYDSDFIYLSSVNQWYSWNVTPDVLSSLSQGEISWCLFSKNPLGLAAFYSKEQGGNVPLLEIYYSDNMTNNSIPLANFSYSIENRDATFFDESLDTDGYITYWHWQFGDGNSSNQKNPYHFYTQNGRYNVNLTIWDNQGATAFHHEILTVPPGYNLPPVANFTYEPSQPTYMDTLNFTDLSLDIDGEIISYEWEFGDGNTSTEKNPQHNYSDNGTYTVNLTVTDNSGATNTFYQVIVIENIHPTAEFSMAPQSPANISTLLEFWDNSTDTDGNIVNWTWDFGDGTIDYGNYTTHLYTSGGVYSVTLSVTDNDGLMGNVSHTIIVTGIADLSITDVTFSPLIPLAGNMVTINVTLYNAGDEPSDLTRITVSSLHSGYYSPLINKERTIDAHEAKSLSLFWYTGEHTSNGNQYNLAPSGDHQLNISYGPADPTIKKTGYNSGHQYVTIHLKEKESTLPGFNLIMLFCAIVPLLLYKKSRKK